ncbi:Protein-lysine N-methyltransferase rrg1 [Golovinomyces cichoracearum]|uniref:Protein-lysine N-methyltransferase rrg1 n=1 Tax=Golovinomyces cichoracearum TaxID=62708 RepID=A0A420H1T7_9PEZI|nr:Protein-lysine N-methyltransferase rrg1 [Golovinomyces cichoracearum]
MEIPNLREKPEFETLLTVLDYKFKSKIHVNYLYPETKKIDETYDFLLRVIRSDLDWLSCEKKDIVYALASKRIAENCGRAAMPGMDRIWMVPATSFHPQIGLKLREPPLIGDDLGLKTWVTSFVVSKQIGQLGHDFFSHFLVKKEYGFDSLKNNLPRPSIEVLELGSGTGLVGMVAAAAWDVSVLLTDLESIQENLSYNIRKNLDTISRTSGGSVSCSTLDWRNPNDAFSEERRFEACLIIASDPLYDDYHPLALTNTIDTFLKKDDRARILTAIPLRDKHTRYLSQEFQQNMLSRHLEIVKILFQSCIDEDWAGSKNYAEGVPLELTIWQRSKLELNSLLS